MEECCKGDVMNQDKLKEKLDQYTDKQDFSVIFSGKMSKKVDGLYHPEKQEIIIHNKNFVNDSELIYTALHELAHHIDFVTNRDKITRNAHGGHFREIFHGLIKKAIESGDYEDFEDPILDETIEMNREYTRFLKKFGQQLIKLLDKCQQVHHNFEDVVDRKLQMKNSQAKNIMAVYAMDVSEEIGGEFSKKVAKIKNPVERKEAEMAGEIPTKTKPISGPEDERAEAEKNLRRIEKAIANLERKRAIYEEQLQGYEDAEAVHG
jgi:hypothetical protein